MREERHHRPVLRPENVCTGLHAVTVRDGPSFPNRLTMWRDGRPLAPGSPGHAKTLLGQLAWWSRPLAAARAGAPYPAPA
ncbi:hypothetical protein ACIPSE_24075 [Streptomyces sp. NPDC090106]|uniref:hypothetical protein n=1 Tax=Streptomyces sp. NPDC090106 TaxID=3365946 RepID=UPI0038205E12